MVIPVPRPISMFGSLPIHFTPLQRHTVTVASPSDLANAHKELQDRRGQFGITAIDDIKNTHDGQSFLLSDLDRNWWQIACVVN